MAIACPLDLDTARLREEIRTIYARVAEDPASAFHFHRGPTYAAGMLGYATLRAKRVEDGPRRPRSPRRSPRSEAADPADSTDPGPISNG